MQTLPSYFRVLSVVIAATTVLCSQVGTEAGSDQPSTYLYLFSPEMNFAKVDLGTLSLQAFWSLPFVSNWSGVLPNCQDKNGCVAARNFLSDSRGHVFAVFPTQAAFTTLRGSSDQALQAGRYQVVAFRLPDLEVIGRFPIPFAQLDAPSLVLSPNGKTLVVEYRDLESEAHASPPVNVVVLDILDATTLAKKRTLRNSAATADYTSGKDVVPLAFSHGASISSDGQLIFDGLSRVELGADHATKTFVNPIASFTDAHRSALSAFTQTVNGKPYYDFHSGETAGGRTLVWMLDSKKTQLAMWTTDLRTGADTPVIISPYGVMHLSTDAKKIFIEEVSQKGESLSGLYKTGRILTYDVDAGTKVGDVSIKALEGPVGDHKFACITPDLRRMIEIAKRSILIVQLGEANAESLNVAFPANSGTACIFSDR